MYTGRRKATRPVLADGAVDLDRVAGAARGRPAAASGPAGRRALAQASLARSATGQVRAQPS